MPSLSDMLDVLDDDTGDVAVASQTAPTRVACDASAVAATPAASVVAALRL